VAESDYDMKCFSPIAHNGIKKLVPCGRCYACRLNMRRSWYVRLKEEQDVCNDSWFITLTYDDKHVPIDIEGNKYVSKDDIKSFNKRFRQNLFGSSRSTYKYFIAAEYGPKTMRPHYHGILFNTGIKDPFELHDQLRLAWSKQKSIGSTEREYFCNQRGITCDIVNDNRIGYVTGYIMDKEKELASEKKVFSLKSKGLGASYFDKTDRIEWHMQSPENAYYPLPDGKKMALPRYYRDKIYSDQERKKMEEQFYQDNFIKHNFSDRSEYEKNWNKHKNNKANAENRHNKLRTNKAKL
jgi:hypothetical protein